MVGGKNGIEHSWRTEKTRKIQRIVEIHHDRRNVQELDVDTNHIHQNYDGDQSRNVDVKSSEKQSSDLDKILSPVENSIVYASLQNESNIHEEQYINFKTFLAACNGTYRVELLSFLFPIFAAFISDLVDSEQHTLAMNFFQKYSTDHEDTYKSELEEILLLLKSTEVIEPSASKLELTELKKRKFVIVLSSNVFGYLMQHMRNNNHSLLLQTMNKRFHIKTTDDANDDYHSDIISSKVDASFAEDNEVQLLNDCIQKVENSSKIKPSVTLYSFINAFQGLSAVKFSPNNNFICAGFEDSSVRLWSLNVKKLAQVKQREANQSKTSATGSSGTESYSSDNIILRGHSGPVYSVQFMPEGSAVLSASEDTTVRLWSVQSQTTLVEYKGHNYPVWDVSTGCKGSYFVSASQDRTARLWTTEYVCPLRIFAGHLSSVDCVQFHPNGNYVATGSSDRTCRLWDLQSAQFVRVFVGHQAPVYTMAFNPDGTYLASAGEDSRVIVWDLRNGKMVEDLRGHTDTLYTLAFSKDGSLLVSGGLDNSIRVWDASSILRNSSDSQMQGSNDSVTHLISAYSTKATSVLEMQFAQGNLLLAAGLHETR